MRRPTAPEIRQFLVRHAEKLGFGAIALLVAAALAGTTWTPYERSPGQLLQSIANARQSLSEGLWPDSEQQRFELTALQHPRIAVDRLLRSRIPASHYARLTPMLRHPVAADQSLREVELHPVQDLEAVQGRALVRLAPEPPLREHPDEASDKDDQPPRPRPDALTRPEDLWGPRPEPTLQTTALPDQQMTKQGRGYPYLSVMGVFDVEAQVRDYMPAVRRNFDDASQLFEILDFRLERQQRPAAHDEWSDWRPVDIEVLKDLLESADGIAPDVVSANVTDSAITCPLPPRWTGVWARTATHPRLENFVLSPEAIEREMNFYRAIINQRRQPLETQRRQKTGKRGFHNFIEDARSLRRDFFATAADSHTPTAPWSANRIPGNNRNDEQEQLIRRLVREMDPENRDRELADWIRRQADPQEHLLMFRYLDFDVDPGMTYRYRVRLEVRNPNYRKPLAAAGGLPHVIRGQTRLTPWSEPTPPTTVDNLVHYFVTSIEQRRSRLYPRARLNLFQYDLELGTTVQQELDVMFGRAIGGVAAARQIDPVRQTIEQKRYPFHSDDILVDALPDLRFRPQDHVGLRLAGGSRGDAKLVPYALVFTPDGRLKTIDAASQAADLARQTTYLNWQNALATDYRDPSHNEFDSGDPNYDDIYQGLFGPPPSPQHPTTRQHPLRRD